MSRQGQPVTHIDEWVNPAVGKPLAWTPYRLGLADRPSWEALRHCRTRH
jgi:hypothetical protein